MAWLCISSPIIPNSFFNLFISALASSPIEYMPSLFNLFAKAEMNGKGVNFLNRIELKEVNGSLKFISENKIINNSDLELWFEVDGKKISVQPKKEFFY